MLFYANDLRFRTFSVKIICFGFIVESLVTRAYSMIVSSIISFFSFLTLTCILLFLRSGHACCHWVRIDRWGGNFHVYILCILAFLVISKALALRIFVWWLDSLILIEIFELLLWTLSVQSYKLLYVVIQIYDLILDLEFVHLSGLLATVIFPMLSVRVRS